MAAELDVGQIARLAALRELLVFAPGRLEDVELVLPAEATALAVLARLTGGEPKVRGDLVGGSNQQGGSGGQFGRFVSVGREFVKAHTKRRFSGSSGDFEREIESERLRLRLGVYHPERVWFASRGSDGWLWVCSVTPELPVLRERFQRSLDRGCWQRYLVALESALELGCSHGVWLDCNPNNFGEVGGELFYIDDDLGLQAGGTSPMLQALLRLREYPQAAIEDRLEFLGGLVAAVLSERRPANLVRDLLRDLDHEVLWPREEVLRNPLFELRRRLTSTRERSR